MPKRRRQSDVPPEVMEIARRELEDSQALEVLQEKHTTAVEADQDVKIHVYLLAERGMTYERIGQYIGGKSPQTVMRYRREGEQAYNSRRQDPERPGEPGEDGGGSS